MEDSVQTLPQDTQTVCCRRWVVILALWGLNLTSGMLWIGYATIAGATADFYNVTLDSVNWFSLVYPLFTILLGFPSILTLERLGIRLSLNMCALLNLASATVRLLVSYDSFPLVNKYPLALVGQCIGALAQPLAMFSPAKVASVWFPPSQRVLANTIAAFGNPFGILLGSLLPPFFISSTNGFLHLAVTLFVVAFAGALLSILGVCQSAPAQRLTQDSHYSLFANTFFAQLKLCFRNLNFMILSVVFGIGLGIFTTLSTLIEQILCPYGYSSTFVGYCGASLIGCGLLGAIISGVVADRTKALLEIFRLCFTLTTFGCLLFAVLTLFPSIEVYIMLSICWIGFFGVAIYSICFEIAAEITFPASENISTGILVISGQIFSMVFILLSSVLYSPLNPVSVPIQCVHSSGRSLWILNMLMGGFGVLGSAIILLKFSVTYSRRSMEYEIVTSGNVNEGEIHTSVSE